MACTIQINDMLGPHRPIGCNKVGGVTSKGRPLHTTHTITHICMYIVCHLLNVYDIYVAS